MTPSAPPPQSLSTLSKEASTQYKRRDFVSARALYLRAAAEAESLSEPGQAAMFLTNAGSAALQTLDYDGALESYFKAREVAERLGDREKSAVISTNIASVLLIAGDIGGAEEAFEVSASQLPAESPYLAPVLAQRARLAVRRGRKGEADRFLQLGLEAAERRWDVSSMAQLWDDVATLRLVEGNLEGAEQALQQEYRLRALFRIGHPEYLLLRLGRLRLAQGRAAEALEWFRRADGAASQAPEFWLPWLSLHDRAVALETLGKHGDALHSARLAWRLAAEWRQERGRSSTVATEVSQSDLATHLVRLLISETGRRPELRRQLVTEAWAVTEWSRTGGSSAWAGRGEAPNSPEYLDLLRRWRLLISRSLAACTSDCEEPAAAATLRARLRELELRGASPAPARRSGVGRTPGALLALTRRGLGRGESLITFHFDEPVSHRWTLVDGELQYEALAGREQLRQSLEHFQAGVRGGRDGAARVSAGVYQSLFREMPEPVRKSGVWLLSLDSEMLQTPLAALRDERGFLVERRALAVLPSAEWLQRTLPARGGLMLAVGDAIHNRADRRLKVAETSRARAVLSSLFRASRPAAASSPESLELPSLPGAGAELRAVVDSWRQGGHPVRELRGASAVVPRLHTELQARPGVLHFASHVIALRPRAPYGTIRYKPGAGAAGAVRLPQSPGDAFLALSLDEQGMRDGLTTAAVASLRLHSPLVVLSGCESGLGLAAPGAGLLGFTRAWLSAGASGVVASLWPVPDDSGPLFQSFYSSLGDGATSAQALQTAQMAMIRSAGEKAEPRYWAAYFLVGKE